MIAVWIILGIVAYLIIGGITAAVVDDVDLESGCIFALPIILFLVVIYGVYIGTKFVGNVIVRTLKQFFASLTSEN
jgi:uncharacterized membrane protein YfcA